MYGCDIEGGTQAEEAEEAESTTQIILDGSDVVTGRRFVLHNEALQNTYSSPSIVRIIMSRRMI
jgi:hypothetical protein